MALGNSSLNNVRTYLEKINNDIKYGDYETNTESVYSCCEYISICCKQLKRMGR